MDILYSRHAKAAIDLATRLLASHQEVEDLAHDAFLEAFTKLDSLRDPGAFRSWLLRILVMKVRQRLRKRALLRRIGLYQTVETATLEAFSSRTVSPEQRAELGRLDAALRELPTDERIAWMLRFVEGHKLQEVADITDSNLTTVKRRIGRADTKVKARVTLARLR